MKDCIPFIRSREFCWSEKHSCYATRTEALNDVVKVLDLYKDTYNKLLAIPVIRGIKTKSEKFAGAEETYTIEAYLPESGKSVQAATSHLLGQNFSKMFDIKYKDKNNTTSYVWQISCGITTRSIGVMLMNHGDDKGSIIPPYVAPIQIVIIPIIKKGSEDLVIDKCQQIYNYVKGLKYRVKFDNNPNHNFGWKCNNYELLGVPLRIEIGLNNNTLTICKRNTSIKSIIKFDDNLDLNISNLLNEIQTELYEKSYTQMMNNITTPTDELEFKSHINNKKICYINWCETNNCEEHIKQIYKSKSLCIPTDLDIKLKDGNCCICNKESNNKVLFGKSF